MHFIWLETYFKNMKLPTAQKKVWKNLIEASMMKAIYPSFASMARLWRKVVNGLRFTPMERMLL